MQITDPKTEQLIELDDYMKQENLYLNEEERPFKIDHTKCLNCQGTQPHDPSKTFDYLCSRCQWHLAGVGQDLARFVKGKTMLRDIESELSDLIVRGETIYFDEVTVKGAIKRVNAEIELETYQEDKEKLIVQLMRLKQLERLGLEWESGY